MMKLTQVVQHRQSHSRSRSTIPNKTSLTWTDLSTDPDAAVSAMKLMERVYRAEPCEWNQKCDPSRTRGSANRGVFLCLLAALMIVLTNITFSQRFLNVFSEFFP